VLMRVAHVLDGFAHGLPPEAPEEDHVPRLHVGDHQLAAALPGRANGEPHEVRA